MQTEIEVCINITKVLLVLWTTYSQWIDMYGIKQIGFSTNSCQQLFSNRLFTWKQICLKWIQLCP